MTREEKISHLKGILSEINENDNAVCYLTSEDNELIESAIEALEQQPCEDCISREQAVDAVADLFEISEYPHPYPQGKPIRLKDIKEKLKQLPPVQPKPKTGHWIPSHIPESILDECSECGFSCGAFTFNYCPMCGAKMIESQESEDKE